MASALPTNIISNWSALIENLEASPMAFFESVEAGVKSREIPKTSSSRIDYRESGLTSAKREYLRLERGVLLFDICAAPYGRGFFVSWWLREPSVHPFTIVGVLFLAFIFVLFLIAVLGFILGVLVSAGMVLVTFWLGSEGFIFDRNIVAMPIIGAFYRRVFKPDTYYAIDTETMFQKATHSAVLEAVDAMMSAKGLRLLSEDERRPTFRRSVGK